MPSSLPSPASEMDVTPYETSIASGLGAPTSPTPALTRESSLKLARRPSIIHDELKASLSRKELKDLMIDVSVPSAVLVDDDARMVKEIPPIPAAKFTPEGGSKSHGRIDTRVGGGEDR